MSTANFGRAVMDTARFAGLGAAHPILTMQASWKTGIRADIGEIVVGTASKLAERRGYLSAELQAFRSQVLGLGNEAGKVALAVARRWRMGPLVKWLSKTGATKAANVVSQLSVDRAVKVLNHKRMSVSVAAAILENMRRGHAATILSSNQITTTRAAAILARMGIEPAAVILSRDEITLARAAEILSLEAMSEDRASVIVRCMQEEEGAATLALISEPRRSKIRVRHQI